jgi:hypothetical protein
MTCIVCNDRGRLPVYDADGWPSSVPCESCSPAEEPQPEFSPALLAEFDAFRRLGMCNMMDRRTVAELSFDLGLMLLNAVAGDKRAYPRLLVAYKREAGVDA